MTLQPVSQQMISDLRAQLPPAVFRDVSPKYLEEPRGLLSGQAALVLAPGSADEVAKIIVAASRARVAIVPFGGGTGLVGGQLKPDDPAPIVLSLERMTEISVDGDILTAQAGATLHDVRATAQAADMLFPLSLASEGSCQIGGNLATNAGGVTVLRYGSARDLCLGVQAVLPDGQTWDGLKHIRKDNTGYDIKNLLIGSEGTLGVICAATLRLFPNPAREAAALMTVASPAAAVELLGMAQRHAGSDISAFELIHRTGLDFLAETMPELHQPFDEPPDWMVMIDLGMVAGSDPVAVLSALYVEAQQAGLASDGIVSQSQSQRQDFWRMRESIPVANKRIGSLASHDISLPIQAIDGFVHRAVDAISAVGEFRINCFGHLGDGNLHFNVFPARGRARSSNRDVGSALRRIVHDLVMEFDGSISAEHGIGRLKMPELERYGDPAKLSAMRAIKTALDPQGIMNPGAVLR